MSARLSRRLLGWLPGGVVVLTVFSAALVPADDSAPAAGTKVVHTGVQFDAFSRHLQNAIRANRMGIVAMASASAGAAARGVKIPGNQVIMVFRNDFAVRMLEASVAAGIEAPLRFYLTENPDGAATLTYRTPSSVFAPYRSPALDKMARELDVIFAKIVADAQAKR
ncbi:MAG: DUF302 domain-containing protein [Alphaproteobacteria bacterium]